MEFVACLWQVAPQEVKQSGDRDKALAHSLDAWGTHVGKWCALPHCAGHASSMSSEWCGLLV